MKHLDRVAWSCVLLPLFLLGGLSCGQAHPEGGGQGPDDPGGPARGAPLPPPPAAGGPATPGSAPPTVTPPNPGSPAPSPSTSPDPTPAPAPTPAPGPSPAPDPTTAAPMPMPAPASGAGVMINGTFVPKEKAIVVIHWGHSNMHGKARTPNSLRPYFYNPVPALWSYAGDGNFVPAKEKTARSPTGNDGNDWAGPGMAILHSLQDSAPAAAGYNFISIGRAEPRVTSVQFMKGGPYYDSFIKLALQLKGKVTFAGMFIMMGITDRHLPSGQQGGFADRISQIVKDVRADLDEPNLPVLHTDYEVTATGGISVNSPIGKLIRPLILSLPSRLDNLVIIPTDQIPLEDDHHFTFVGQKTWAQRGVDLMKMKGWLPWAPAATQP